MKIVEVGEVMPEPGETTPFRIKLLGWLLALAMAAAALAGFVLANMAGDARIALIVAREGGVASWHEDGFWIAVAFVAMLIPFVLIPGVFGVRSRQLLPAMPRHRWKVVWALLAAQTAAMVFVGVFVGQDGGFSTSRDVAWFRGGKIVERHPLTSAEVVRTRCVMTYDKRDDRAKPPTRPMLDYTVQFAKPGGGSRYARMDWSVKRRRATLVPWIQRLTLVDAAFRAAGVRREAQVDEACLLSVMDGDPVAAAALGRFMR